MLSQDPAIKHKKISMKYFIPLFFALLYAVTIEAQKNEKDFNHKLILGKWISMDDKNYQLEVTDSTFIEHYEDDNPDIFKYELKGQKLYKTEPDGTVYEYVIMSLSNDILVLQYLPRGNLLSFKRKNTQKH